MKKKSAVLFGLLFGLALQAQPSQWPLRVTRNGSTIVTYQPQVEDWKNFAELDWRSAFTVTPPGGTPAVGVMSARGKTDTDPGKDLVMISQITIKTLHFPSLEPATAAKMEQLVRSLVPEVTSISLRQLTACVPAETAPPPRNAAVRNDPPAIFVSARPAILLFVEGQPQLAAIKDTSLEFVVNTIWPVFLDKPKATYYLLVGDEWLTANNLAGPWATAAKLPPDMAKLPKDQMWASLAKVIPPPTAKKPVVPTVFYSTAPAEVVLFEGAPKYEPIPGTGLRLAANTESDVIVDTSTNHYYVLISGRWFRSNGLNGPWTFATPDLPTDFAKIPANSSAARVLESVPGTDEAKDAVLLAQVPTTIEVDPATASKQAKVTYSGPPKFEPIAGTPLSYATNTADKVIKSGDVYYLCLQGIWFLSTTPQGPWTTASSVPEVIYTIPASSPVHNVTYVTQTTTSTGTVTASHTAGYVGAFVIGLTVGAVITHGSGYYYPPYIYRPPYGYPIYHPYPVTYGYHAHYYGPYGSSHAAYTPYGAARVSAGYNPYTGTYARGGTVATPYGSRSAAQAYNPYTGAYAATAQGSAPGSQWGSSVVSKGGQSAYAQHYSTAQGTVGSIQTSEGGKAVGARGSGGSAMAGKTAGGDMYAGKDGNVYKNTGEGWNKYDNGSWNAVTPPSTAGAQQRAASGQQRAQSAQGQAAASGYSTHDLNNEMQNRQRGSAQASAYQRSGSSSRSSGTRSRRR